MRRSICWWIWRQDNAAILSPANPSFSNLTGRRPPLFLLPLRRCSIWWRTIPDRLSASVVFTPSSARGKQLMDSLRGQFKTFIAAEESLRRERSEDARRRARVTLVGALVLILIL